MGQSEIEEKWATIRDVVYELTCQGIGRTGHKKSQDWFDDNYFFTCMLYTLRCMYVCMFVCDFCD